MRARLYYGWIMVAVTATVALVTAGTRAAPGAFLLSMQADTGYSKTELSIAAGVGLLLYGLAGPLAGALMNRLGVKRVAAISVLTTATALVLTSLSHEIWQFAIFFGLVTGLSTGLVASSFGAMVASRWFVKHRGMVTGVFGASSSVGQLIFIPILAILATTIGWRNGAVLMAAVTAVLIVPVLIFMRDDPGSMGLAPLGAAPGTPIVTAKPKADPGIMRRAVGSRDFWLLAGTFFVCGWTTNGIISTHFIPAMHDHGMGATTAAGLLAVVGLFDIIGTIGSGWLTDRVNPRVLLGVYYGLRGIALISLPLLLGPNVEPPIIVIMILFGLDWVATVPPTASLCREIYGIERGAIVFGWVFAAHMVGAAAAAIITGSIRVQFGDYFTAWLLAGALALAAALAALAIPRRPAPTPSNEAVSSHA